MRHGYSVWIASVLFAFLAVPISIWAAPPDQVICRVLADQRLKVPLTAIGKEFQRRRGIHVILSFLPVGEVNETANAGTSEFDVVLVMAKPDGDPKALALLADPTKVAWKHPSGEPVWAAATKQQEDAIGFIRFVGGPTGHRLWSESPAGFTIVGGKTHADAIDWVAKNRVGHTYPLTAARMLAECGGIRVGICIDIGCGTGALDIELARRSKLTIIGLDIDREMKPLFDKRVSEAGFQDRIRFVAGDAQDLPFKDDYAITEGKCLLICANDGAGTQSLQHGLIETTDLEVIALYPTAEVASQAKQRIAGANLSDQISCQHGKLDDGLSFSDGSFDLITGIGPVLIWGDREMKMREVHRVLRPGGVAPVGGKFLGMPDFRKVSSDDLRDSAVKTDIPSIRVIESMGQWIEIRRGKKDRK